MYLSDRRWWLTADRTQAVEEGDPRAAFLLVGKGCMLEDAIALQYGLLVSDSATAIRSDTETASEPESEAVSSKAIEEPPENKAIWPAENKRVKRKPRR